MKRTAFSLIVAGVSLAAACRGEKLPADLKGTLVFVSNRDGRDAVYLRRLPDGADFQLTSQTEPVEEPALSPDGRQVAFSMGGRIGLITVETHEVKFVTLGVDWKDQSPSWRPDGKALVVAARRDSGQNADLHLLMLGAPAGSDVRRPLTRTDHMDETSPSFSPEGTSIAFVRGDNVFRLSVGDGATVR